MVIEASWEAWPRGEQPPLEEAAGHGPWVSSDKVACRALKLGQNQYLTIR